MKLVKCFIYSVFTLSFGFACSTSPEGALLATSKLNSQDLEPVVIDYSYNLLVEKGLEPAGLSYDTADFAIVQFPSGDQGFFVVIGILGFARGYQLLYRIEDEQYTLIEPIRIGRYVWGLKSAQSEKRASAQADIEFLDIFTQRDSKWKDILKVTGAGHAGSGLWDDGYFEILAVTDNGLQELFTGVEFVTNSTTFDSYSEYQFVDLDGDGVQEILEAIENCEYRLSKDTWQKDDLECQQSQKIYKLDSKRYVPQR